jgi:hypothetical protein
MYDQPKSTDYRCSITLPGPPVIVFLSTTVTVVSAYCAPFVLTYGCNYGDTINDFILVGESNTRINDIATGCAANNYDNRISESVTLFAGMAYVAFISTQYSSSEYVGIWIDFNNNCDFESSEEVGSIVLSSTSDTAITITIPAIGSGVAVGTYRMRVTDLYAAVANPCGPPAFYGETHDYTVNIIAYACKLNYFE